MHFRRCENDIGLMQVEVGFEDKCRADQLLENATHGLLTIAILHAGLMERGVHRNGSGTRIAEAKTENVDLGLARTAGTTIS